MTFPQWFLRAEDLTREGFARQHGLGLSTVRRMAKGERVSGQIALKVSRATQGEVSIEELLLGEVRR